jgi:hypothetical protein
LKDASCPTCFRIGAAEGTGDKFLRAEGIKLQSSGAYQGTKVFTDTFKCKFCSHAWERGEKSRQVSLCPKCFDEKPPAKTGEKTVTCKKSAQRSQQGQPLAEQVFVECFRCTACSHTWDGEQKVRLVESCPACLKEGTREATGEHVFLYKKTDQWSQHGVPVAEQAFTNTFKCKECSHEWNDGQHTRLVEVCPHCEKPNGIVSLGEQVATASDAGHLYRCNLCAKEWQAQKPTRTGGQAARQKGLLGSLWALVTNYTCPKCKRPSGEKISRTLLERKQEVMTTIENGIEVQRWYTCEWFRIHVRWTDDFLAHPVGCRLVRDAVERDTDSPSQPLFGD